MSYPYRSELERTRRLWAPMCLLGALLAFPAWGPLFLGVAWTLGHEISRPTLSNAVRERQVAWVVRFMGLGPPGLAVAVGIVASFAPEGHGFSLDFMGMPTAAKLFAFAWFGLPGLTLAITTPLILQRRASGSEIRAMRKLLRWTPWLLVPGLLLTTSNPLPYDSFWGGWLGAAAPLLLILLGSAWGLLALLALWRVLLPFSEAPPTRKRINAAPE